MKKVLNLRFFLQAFCMIAATINLFIAMDVIYSSIDNLTYSAIHNLPAQGEIIGLFCTNAFACLIGFALAGKLVINREASKKTVRCFSLLFIILSIIFAEAYDVHFSMQRGMPKSMLLSFPAEKWVCACITFAGIGLLIPFTNLYHELIHVKVAAEEPKPKEEDTDQR